MKCLPAVFSPSRTFNLCKPAPSTHTRDSYKPYDTDGKPAAELVGIQNEAIGTSTPTQSVSDQSDDLPIIRKEEVSAPVASKTLKSTAQDINLPSYDKDAKSKELIREAIQSNEFLKNLEPGQVEAVIWAMYPKSYEAYENVITQGETGSHLYVSAEGLFEVFIGNKKVFSFGPGRAFGEVAILYNTKRNATVQVVTAAQVWVLDRLVFQKIMLRTRLQDIEDKVNFLRSHPLLKDLSTQTLATMSDLLQVEFFPTGKCIIRQGDRGDKFYMITGGSVKITKLETGAEKEEEVGTLLHGDYFGELALMQEETRQATVTALAPGVECLVLERGPFIQLLGDLEELRKTDKYKPPRDNGPALGHDSPNVNLKYTHISLEDLDIIGTLGVGGFGRVELVQYRKDKNMTFALKCLKKCYVVEQQQEEHAYNEKGVMLACADSPFISRLYRTYKDNKFVYFLMEACLGGDLFTVLQKYRFFDDHTARFMTACVVEALQFLHERGFIYRDLKPENLLLDAKGYIKMIDFGFAKRVGSSGKTWTFAGTPEYVAPEIILNKGHDRAVDYWALGVFIHELLVGKPPFRGKDHMQTYNLILKGIESVHFPKHVTKAAQSLVRRLCRAVATERLGYQKAGVQEIKNHRWFQGFNWEALRNRNLLAPVIRPIRGPTDLGNFDKYPKDKTVPPDELSGWDKDF